MKTRFRYFQSPCCLNIQDGTYASLAQLSSSRLLDDKSGITDQYLYISVYKFSFCILDLFFWLALTFALTLLVKASTDFLDTIQVGFYHYTDGQILIITVHLHHQSLTHTSSTTQFACKTDCSQAQFSACDKLYITYL